MRRNFGPEVALRLSVRDAAGRLRTTLSEGSWPEEADAASVTRRRPAFERGVDLELRLPSPAGMVLLLLPVVVEGETLGIVEIIAPKAAAAEHRSSLRAFVDSIASRYVLPASSLEARRKRGSTKDGGVERGKRGGKLTPLRVVLQANGEPAPPGKGDRREDLRGIRVLIVHKHKMFAEAIRSVLEEIGSEVLQPVEDPTEALAIARRMHPDVVLIDLALNGSAIGLGTSMREECADARIIGLTAGSGHDKHSEALRSGFHGYLTQDVSLDRFIVSMKATLNGEMVVTRDSSPWTAPVRSQEERHAAMLASHLTPRERQVLALLVEGMSGPQIAQSLSASRNTVRTHIQSILGKLQVHSRLEAATFAAMHGLVRPAGDPSPARTDGGSHPFGLGHLRRASHESGDGTL